MVPQLWRPWPWDSFNVYSWRCTWGGGIIVDNISMNAACKEQYGNSAPTAYFTNESNPYSWRCR